MHPTLTFDLIQADHRDRLEAARLESRHTARAARPRPSGERRGRPPERPSRVRLRGLLAVSTPAATIR